RRGREGLRRPQGRPPRPRARGRDRGVLQGAAHPVQGSADRRVPRCAAADRDGQDAAAPAERVALNRIVPNPAVRVWRTAAPLLTAGAGIRAGGGTLARLPPNPTLLPSPLEVVLTLGRLVGSGVLFVHSGTSLGRIFLSWVLAALVAIPLGIAMGRSERLERF